MSNDPASHDAFKWECRRKQVESLRIPWEGMGAMANTERHIAALMIENLMEEVEAWKKAMQKAERDMAELRKSMIDVDIRIEAEADFRAEIDKKNLTIKALTEERDEVVRMANKLTAQRDDARALYCGMLEAYKRGDGREEAKKRGWFCFSANKEN